MSQLDERLNALQKELDALSRIKTQEDFDEGARLHNAKNAPWVSGMYSHLLDHNGRLLSEPPYVHQEYPKALYRPEFLQAAQEVQDAKRLPGVTDAERQAGVKEAERILNQFCCLAVDEADERLRVGMGWHASPDAAKAAEVRANDELAVQAAHLAYEDRNLGDKARRERDAADDASDGHLVEVPVKRGRPAKVTI